jgi:hypothetical protein
MSFHWLGQLDEYLIEHVPAVRCGCRSVRVD